MDDLISRQMAAEAIRQLAPYIAVPEQSVELACRTLSILPAIKNWSNHEVAELLAEAMGDTCACNVNGNDEWLPEYCEFAETVCPHVVGVTCWEQYLTHRGKRTKGGSNE